MDMAERNRIMAERQKAVFAAPFEANSGTPERPIPVEHRVAHALDYIAAQLGTIAKSAQNIERMLESQGIREAQRDAQRR